MSNLPQYLQILIFVSTQIVSVIANTLKYVITVKGTKISATIINTIQATLSTIITYLVGRSANLELWVIILVTICTNIFGVWIGLFSIEKIKHTHLWRISATVKTEHYQEVIVELKKNNIKFVTFETDWEKVKLIDVFSETKEQSIIIKNLFTKYDVKFTIDTHINYKF